MDQKKPEVAGLREAANNLLARIAETKRAAGNVYRLIVEHKGTDDGKAVAVLVSAELMATRDTLQLVENMLEDEFEALASVGFLGDMLLECRQAGMEVYDEVGREG